MEEKEKEKEEREDNMKVGEMIPVDEGHRWFHDPADVQRILGRRPQGRLKEDDFCLHYHQWPLKCEEEGDVYGLPKDDDDDDDDDKSVGRTSPRTKEGGGKEGGRGECAIPVGERFPSWMPCDEEMKPKPTVEKGREGNDDDESNEEEEEEEEEWRRLLGPAASWLVQESGVAVDEDFLQRYWYYTLVRHVASTFVR